MLRPLRGHRWFNGGTEAGSRRDAGRVSAAQIQIVDIVQRRQIQVSCGKSLGSGNRMGDISYGI